MTGEELTTEDLLPLKATQTSKPRPITATSIPGLLSHFQVTDHELCCHELCCHELHVHTSTTNYNHHNSQ